jgi:hypothetical protein
MKFVKQLAAAATLGGAILIGDGFLDPSPKAAYIVTFIQEGPTSSRPEVDHSTWPT